MWFENREPLYPSGCILLKHNIELLFIFNDTRENVRFDKRSRSDIVLKHLKNTDLVQLPQLHSGEDLPGEK